MAKRTEASSDTPDPVQQERRRLVPPPGKSPLVRALELSAGVVNQYPPPGERTIQDSEISLTLSQGSEQAITYKTLSDDSGMLIEVGVDAGWTTSQIDQKGNTVEITVLTTDGAANVIMSREPIETGFDEAQIYAEEQVKLLEQGGFPKYHQLAFEATKVFGVPGFRHVYEWDPKKGPPVTQIQQYYAENGRGYLATATASSSDSKEYEPQLLDALHRITLIR